jgi:ABC-type multidrug transport system fused ATPase/permease subunit
MLLFLLALIGETVAGVRAPLLFHVGRAALPCDMRVAIFAHVQKLPLSYFDRKPVGRLVTRMTYRCRRAARNVFFRRADAIIRFHHGRLDRRIMFYLHAGLALVSLALIPPMALAINFFRVKARQNYRQIRERIARS